jgi:hypothetical protein
MDSIALPKCFRETLRFVERLAQNPNKTECFHFPLFPSESWWKVLMSTGGRDNHRADAVLSAASQQKDPPVRNVSRSAKISGRSDDLIRSARRGRFSSADGMYRRRGRLATQGGQLFGGYIWRKALSESVRHRT